MAVSHRGAISFGMVHIPVGLYTATQDKDMPEGNEDAVWIAPERVCTVRYMERTESGHMRQPVFHGWRDDKTPQECTITE